MSKRSHYRFPSKRNSLHYIRGFSGDSIQTVIDVGILYSTPELMQNFPDKKHVLVEPVSLFNEVISQNYEGIDYDLLNVAASKDDGVMRLQLRNHLPNFHMDATLE